MSTISTRMSSKEWRLARNRRVLAEEPFGTFIHVWQNTVKRAPESKHEELLAELGQYELSPHQLAEATAATEDVFVAKRERAFKKWWGKWNHEHVRHAKLSEFPNLFRVLERHPFEDDNQRENARKRLVKAMDKAIDKRAKHEGRAIAKSLLTSSGSRGRARSKRHDEHRPLGSVQLRVEHALRAAASSSVDEFLSLWCSLFVGTNLDRDHLFGQLRAFYLPLFTDDVDLDQTTATRTSSMTNPDPKNYILEIAERLDGMVTDAIEKKTTRPIALELNSLSGEMKGYASQLPEPPKQEEEESPPSDGKDDASGVKGSNYPRVAS